MKLTPGIVISIMVLWPLPYQLFVIGSVMAVCKLKDCIQRRREG